MEAQPIEPVEAHAGTRGLPLTTRRRSHNHSCADTKQLRTLLLRDGPTARRYETCLILDAREHGSTPEQGSDAAGGYMEEVLHVLSG